MRHRQSGSGCFCRQHWLDVRANAAAEDNGKILRPADNSWYQAGPVDLVATAESGKLQLDGAAIQAEQPFPERFSRHVEGIAGAAFGGSDVGRRQERSADFSSAPIPPAGYQAFHQHPPVPGIQCTQCHELNARGRFVFKGGCFDCHQNGRLHKDPHS